MKKFATYIINLFRRRELDKHFSLNRRTYERDFLPAYTKLGTNPNSIFQCGVILPFHVPISSSTCFTFQLNDISAVTVVLQRVTTQHQLAAGLVNVKNLKVPVLRTRAELIYATTESLAIPQGDIGREYLANLYDLLVEKLNLCLTSYLITSKDTSVYRVTKGQLEFASLYRIISIADWKEEHGLFLAHLDGPVTKENISSEEVEKVVWFANVIQQEWNPIILSEEISLNARRYLAEGLYRESVVYAQISVETFLAALITELLKAEGLSSSEIEDFRAEKTFIRLVRSEFHSRLGGKWDLDDMASTVGVWKTTAYDLRNRVVHAGYFPSFHESSEAIDSCQKLRLYVASLVKGKKVTYPDLWRYFDVNS